MFMVDAQTVEARNTTLVFCNSLEKTQKIEQYCPVFVLVGGWQSEATPGNFVLWFVVMVVMSMSSGERIAEADARRIYKRIM